MMMMNETKKAPAKQAIFTIGGPASGKSTVLSALFNGAPVLDCDSIKETHPAYDPKDPGALHVWSREELKKRFFETVEGDASFAYDGTGCNVTRMIEWITIARNNGFEIVLLYVTCSLEEALRRNAARDRNVPTEIVAAKHAVVAECFAAVRDTADEVIEYANERFNAALAA